jgi:hypothetical protein
LGGSVINLKSNVLLFILIPTKIQDNDIEQTGNTYKLNACNKAPIKTDEQKLKQSERAF